MRIEPMAGARVFVREDGWLQFEGWKIDNPAGASAGFRDEMLAILEWMKTRVEDGPADLGYSGFTTWFETPTA